MSAVGHAVASDADAPLVEAARGGDVGAFERLVERHRDVVTRVAARVVGDDDAEDVAQDAFLRAFHRLDAFREEAAFRTWLLQITHNAALSAVAGRPDAGPISADDSSLAPGSPVEQLERRERLRRLDLKLKGLSPTHRAVLVLRDVEGLSYEEIAEVTGAPLGSVKARLHRARGELIELLRTNTYDWDLPR